LEAEVTRVVVPGVVPGAGPTGALEARVRELRLDGATVALVRESVPEETGSAEAQAAESEADGPPSDGAGSHARSAAQGDDAETERASAEPPAEPAMRVAIDDLVVARSELSFIDRAVGAPVRAEIGEIDLRARGVVWPEPRPLDSLELRMRGPAG